MKEGLKMQSVKFSFIFVVVFSLITGCNGQKKAAVDTSTEEKEMESPLTLVIQENYAPSDGIETLVITSGKGLSKFFSEVNRTRKPGIPVPQIDFSKEMVIIYCAGKDANGTEPKVMLAEETETELILKMENIKHEDKPTSSVNPFTIYTMPTTTKQVRFKAME